MYYYFILKFNIFYVLFNYIGDQAIPPLTNTGASSYIIEFTCVYDLTKPHTIIICNPCEYKACFPNEIAVIIPFLINKI